MRDGVASRGGMGSGQQLGAHVGWGGGEPSEVRVLGGLCHGEGAPWPSVTAGLRWPLRGHLLAVPRFSGHVSGLGARALLGKRKQEVGGWVVGGLALPSC